MAGLENLFAAEPTLPSVQTTKLPDDPNQWAEVITTKLREQYPDVTRLPLTVEFRKKDDPSGTAVGSIHVMASDSGKILFVPFVVRKYELEPLDIWMEAKTQAVHPLTNDTFKEEFFVQSSAEGLDVRPADSAGQYFNDPSTWNTNYPPLQGRYSYASAGYQILDGISDTMTTEDLQTFRALLEKEAASLPRFRKHGHQEILQKLAAKKGVAINDFAASATKLIPIGAASIKRESKDKYSILSMADQLFDLAESEYMNRDACLKHLSKISPKPWDLLHDVDQEGEKMVLVKSAPREGVFLYDDVREKPESADELGVYSVKDKAGVTLEGVVIPQVVDFSGKKQSYKLFISPGHSTFQSSISGVKRESTDKIKKILEPRAARVGQTGTFVFVDDGKAIATIPVTMKAIENGGYGMVAIKLDGTKIRIKRGYGDDPSSNFAQTSSPDGKKDKNFLDVHGMIETRPHEYIIPQRMFWVPMEGFQEVSSSASEWLQKEASQHMDMNPLTVRWTGIVYDISGAGMDKTASLSERQLGLALATRGASLEKVAQIVKAARASGRAKVHGLAPLRKAADIIKVAEVAQRDLEWICKSFKMDLIKCAAELEDSVTVDAMLSLNFVNPDNLAKFVSYRPVFTKVLDYLAELTLATRLGFKDISESAVIMAMGKLQEVSEGLKKAEASLKKPSVKTAAAKPAKKPAPKKPQGKPEAKPQQQAAQPKPPIADKQLKAPPGVGIYFAKGMADAEMGTHMNLEAASRSPRDMLDYVNGKRLVEQNKAQSGMLLGIPPKGAPKPKQPGA
jgi:hypothetical protein